ncbi:glycerate kinase type-2 family protein [Phaeobacter sp. C3_T13_0]|uniref:glycerate kinase type-2 family protein n=1 Tax=Phaeobacter cretensis TaxID=3342641 RepID=UPI0039BC91C3
MPHLDPEMLLRVMFAAAISAADPATVLAQHLPEKPAGRCIVVGAGKSAAAMARALEIAWPDVDISGVVVTRYGHSVPCSRIIVREASHPVPNASGEAAAMEILATAHGAGADDLVLALISGGGSSLMPMPVAPLSLADKIDVNQRLLASGLTIETMNKVRRRLSAIKGGGLARAAHPARLVTLAISDVPGDHPANIASGPTVSDPSADEDLSYLLESLGDDLPAAVVALLAKRSDALLDFKSDFRLIATPMMALTAAAEIARAAGVRPMILGDAIEGEARELGIGMAGIAKSAAAHGYPIARPCVLLSGGESTVSIGAQKPGRGGRNTEFLLSLAIALNGLPGIYALAGDTDGIDGTEDAAGAIVGPSDLARAADLGLNPQAYLQAHDSYSLLDRLERLVKTGPTLTNVNDFRAVLVS